MCLPLGRQYQISYLERFPTSANTQLHPELLGEMPADPGENCSAVQVMEIQCWRTSPGTC